MVKPSACFRRALVAADEQKKESLKTFLNSSNWSYDIRYREYQSIPEPRRHSFVERRVLRWLKKFR